MEFLISVLLTLIALPPGLSCLYLGVLTLLSQRLPAAAPSGETPFFDIIVPAHQEEAVIARTVSSLNQLDWPSDRRRILVVADNCTDTTAARAEQAGATVLVRQNEQERGKGYALRFAMQRSDADGLADAVVVIDADSTVTPNLLQAYAARLAQGAQAIQARYGVLNPDDSWLIRLVAIAYGAFHDVRSRARERLVLSCGLRGNGMCFSQALLRQHPWNAYSLTEDVEYGITLGLNDIRVHYVDEASVDAELPNSMANAASQRQRWEGGRAATVRTYLKPLLKQALTTRKRLCIDLALDILIPPLANITLLTCLSLLCSLIAWAIWPGMAAWVWASVMMVLIQIAYVLRGWRLSRLPVSALLELLRAPFFIIWKLLLRVRRTSATQWVKTRRNDDK